MTASLAHIIASTEQTGSPTRELPLSPITFGVLAMVVFLLLLGVLWAFRGTANKLAADQHVQYDNPSRGDAQGGHH